MFFVKDAFDLFQTSSVAPIQGSTLTTFAPANHAETLQYIFTAFPENDPFVNFSPLNLKVRAADTIFSSVMDFSALYSNDPKYLNEDGVDERLLFKYTLPQAKLFYPEPFIASPSYIHSDLIFLNILQYWY